MRADLPTLWTNLHTVLNRWQTGGVAARAELGEGLRLDPYHERVARMIQITRPDTHARVRRADDRRYRYEAHWHVDNHGADGSHNFHWVWLMVDKPGGSENHTNLCVASTADVDACDSPTARSNWATGESHDRMLDRLECCPSVHPGDAVFYREDVAHRTQDSLNDRLGMVIQIDTQRPKIPTPEDVRCAEWAKGGHCRTKFMTCACPRACDPGEL